MFGIRVKLSWILFHRIGIQKINSIIGEIILIENINTLIIDWIWKAKEIIGSIWCNIIYLINRKQACNQ